MKKTLLFLTVFLFFGFVSAEDVQVYKDGSMILIGERWTEQELEEESAMEPEPEKEPEAEDKNKTEVEKIGLPEWVYIQPMFSVGVTRGGDDPSVFTEVFNASVQIDFRIAHTKGGHNFYLGLDLGFKYHHLLYHAWDIPLLSNVVFDFKTNVKNNTPEYVSIWFAFGVGIGHYDPYYVDLISSDSVREHGSSIRHSWGIGTDLKFENGIVLQFGIKSLAFLIPIPMVGLGYRF